jgi:peptidoglycan/LPS O-acetylase OafA/YrhL
MNTIRRPLHALTGVRFVLAFWVILYHQIPHSSLSLRVNWLPDFLPDAFSIVLRTGYVAVTVFFVLSGFVLAYNYDLSGPWNAGQIRRFFAARFSRIYPAYFAGLLLMAPLMAWRATKLDPDQRFLALLTAGFNFTLLQAWIPDMAMTWNYPGWSLSNEAFFYACFPFVGVWLWRRLRSMPALVTGVIVLWAVSVAAPFIAVLLPVPGFGELTAASLEHTSPTAAFEANLIRYNPALRLAEFCAGILLAGVYRMIPVQHPLSGRGWWIYGPSMVLCAAILSHADRLPYAPTHNGLLLPLYMLIVLGLALDGGFVAHAFSTRQLIFLGNASYTMYIFHAPVQSWLMLAWRSITGSFPVATPGWVALYALFVLGFSSLFFVLVEEPVHQWLRQRLAPRRAPVSVHATLS